MRLPTERKRHSRSSDLIKPVEDFSTEFDYERDIPKEKRQLMESYAQEIIDGFHDSNGVKDLRLAVDFLQAIGKEPKFDKVKLRRVCENWKEGAEVKVGWFDDGTEQLLAFLDLDHTLRTTLQPVIQKATESLSLERLRQHEEQPLGTTLRSMCTYGVILLPEHRKDFYALADQWFPGHGVTLRSHQLNQNFSMKQKIINPDDEIVTRGILKKELKTELKKELKKEREWTRSQLNHVEYRLINRMDKGFEAINQKLDKTVDNIQKLADQVIKEHKDFEVESVAIKDNYNKLEGRVHTLEEVVLGPTTS